MTSRMQHVRRSIAALGGVMVAVLATACNVKQELLAPQNPTSLSVTETS